MTDSTTEKMTPAEARAFLNGVRRKQRMTTRELFEMEQAEVDPIVEAAGRARKLLIEAGMADHMREITKRAKEVCNGDPTYYMDYVRRCIADEQDKRRLKAEIASILSDLPNKVQLDIRLMAHQAAGDESGDLSKVVAQVKRLASVHKALYEVALPSYRQSFFCKDDHQYIDITFYLYSEDRDYNLNLITRLDKFVAAMPNVWHTYCANVSPDGLTTNASRGMPGRYHLWVWADPGTDIYDSVVLALKTLPVEAWR